jgi:hypothetical protein
VSQCGCSDEQVRKCRRGERVVLALTGLWLALGRQELRNIHKKLQKCTFVLFQSRKLCMVANVERRGVNVAQLLGTADSKCI